MGEMCLNILMASLPSVVVVNLPWQPPAPSYGKTILVPWRWLNRVCRLRLKCVYTQMTTSSWKRLTAKVKTQKEETERPQVVLTKKKKNEWGDQEQRTDVKYKTSTIILPNY